MSTSAQQCVERNNVHDLLRPRERNLWTSNSKTTTRNWNVDGLLQKKKIFGTFRNCSTICGSRRTAREGQDEQEILGTATPARLLGDQRVEKHSSGCPPSAAQVHRESAPWEQRERGQRSAPQRAAEPAPVAEAQREPRAATRQALPRTTGRAPEPPAALVVCLRGALCAASALSVFCARGPVYFASAATLS